MITLLSSWCETRLELIRHGGVEMVGSLERLLIVFHALLLLCGTSVNVMTSSYLFSSVN